MYFGLTSLGMVHTAISLVAVAAGFVLLLRDGAISLAGRTGKVYFVTTVLTALTGFGIFQHGGFGKPHALGVLTLIVLGVALAARYTPLFGRFSKHVEVVGYSATFLFHWIPAITETSTRLPLGNPWLASPEAPELKAATGVLVLLFLVGVTLQVLRLRKGAAPA